MAALIRRNRNFRLVFSAEAVSSLGDGVSLVALPWLATLITRDALLIGAVAAAGRLPWLVFSLPAGVIVDRGDRRSIMFRADLASALATFGIVALVLGLPALPPPGGPLPWIAALSAGIFLLGAAEVFHDNAAQTVLPSLVENTDLEQANSQLWTVARAMQNFVGPPLAGLLLVLAVPAPFAFDAVSFVLAAGAVWAVTQPAQDLARTERASFRRELGEGIRWLFAHRLILQLAVMLGLMNLITTMALTTFVLYAQEVLGLNAAHYGLVLTAEAVGGVFGGLIAPTVVRRLGANRTVMLSLAVNPLPYLGLWLGTSVWLAVLALFFGVLAGMLWNVVTVSLRQRMIPDSILGRVNSLYRFFGWGMMPLGALVSGWLIERLSPLAGRIAALHDVYLIVAIAMAGLLAYAAARLRLPHEA